MLVEDRLRQGLEANATSFTPATEWRLAQVHRRRRRRRTTNAVASLGSVAAAAAAVAAVQLGGGSLPVPSPDPGPAAPGPGLMPPASSQPTVIPEMGGYGRQATEAEGLASGVPRGDVEQLVGKDGVVPLGFRLEQGIYTIWTNDDRFSPTAHDYGTYAFEDGGRLVLTSMTDTCPGCTTTLSWRWKGRDLVFGSVERETDGDVAWWLWSGRWYYSAPG
ncbi:hypothetical protein [Nocardioides sp.]|uniref:hypothetical protein n=1 Tax=Nocardioides sp. TaxID=35761 RepID=UPI0035B17961